MVQNAAKAGAKPARLVGPETSRNHERRLREGFYDRYLAGDAVLDIGYKGGVEGALPVTEKAIGVELDYPGYDGIRLPFDDCTQDAVFASHCLEHIDDPITVLADWFRVLRQAGFLVIAVPHQWLYERKADLPSRFNGDHKRFYTPRALLDEIERALPVACWRLRSLRDIDEGFSYALPPEVRPIGSYEIELVVQKIAPPDYASRLMLSASSLDAVRLFAQLLARSADANASGRTFEVEQTQLLLTALPLPAFLPLKRHLPNELDQSALKNILRPIIARAPFDETDYLARYPDIAQAVKDGRLSSGHAHYVQDGYFRGRTANPVSPVFA